MSRPLLSILVPTIPQRLDYFYPSIMRELLCQARKHGDAVEILSLFDNRLRSVGEKRNELLRMAQGDWLAFVDDDDRVAPEYIDEIVRAIKEESRLSNDLIAFAHVATKNGRHPQRCRYSLRWKEITETRSECLGPPTHTCCWRSIIAKAVKFPHVNLREDAEWVEGVAELAQGEIQIDKALYFYDFNSSTTATRDEARNARFSG